MTVSGLAAVTYQYDNANRLVQVAQGALAVGLSYDAGSRRTGLTLPNGLVTTYGFDDANELLALSYDKNGTHVGDIAYTYDQAGRRVTESGSLATLLIPGTVSTTAYDAANRLTNWGGTALSYDNNGNLSTLGSATFGWNARNQLIATAAGGGEFSYDSFGRRTSRTVSGTTTPYLHDGWNPATVAGSLMLDGLGLDEMYAQVNSTATTSYLTDGLGSTVALTDSTGAIASSYSYTPYGTDSRTGTADTPFQFTGRENDTDTSLYYYRTRYYSPQLGRFISEDPLGLGGGVNTYAYANGNPTNLTDPSGQCPICVVALYYAVIYAEEITVASIIAAEVAADVPNPVSSTASFGERAAQELTHDVYLGLQNGKPAYVGITNAFSRRASEWSGIYDLKKLTSCPVTKDQARGIEQAIINANPKFNNAINSISPTRSWYPQATDWGSQWLQDNGFGSGAF